MENPIENERECPICNGSGHLLSHPQNEEIECHSCDGTGTTTLNELEEDRLLDKADMRMEDRREI